MKTITKNPALLVIIIAIGIAAIALSFNGLKADAQCKASIERLSKMKVEEIVLINDAGAAIKFAAYIADDGNKRAEGYQHICAEVINKTHILFVYSQPIEGRFHMQNVQAPLDIGFFDSAGGLISTMLMNTYADGNSRLYYPGRAFQYALEAGVGFFHKHNLSAGQARLVLSSVNGG